MLVAAAYRASGNRLFVKLINTVISIRDPVNEHIIVNERVGRPTEPPGPRFVSLGNGPVVIFAVGVVGLVHGKIGLVVLFRIRPQLIFAYIWVRLFVLLQYGSNDGILVRNQRLIRQLTLDSPVGILALRHRPDALGIEGSGAVTCTTELVNGVGILVVQVEAFAGLGAAYVLCYRLCDIPGKIPLGKVETCLRVGLAHFGKDG